MRKIDISNCPPEFALAYLEHIHAWEKLSVTYKVIKQWNSDENINNIIVQSYFNEILNTNINTFKNVIEIENELRNQFANDQKIIRETYYSAEKIAVKFGAKLPSKN